METLQKIITHWAEPEILAQYSEYLLLIVFLYSFLEVIFPPLPGDTLLIISGSISVAANSNPLFMIIFASLGTFCASFLLYHLGAKMERKLFHSPRFSALLDSKTFVKIERGFQRFGFFDHSGQPVSSGGTLRCGIGCRDRQYGKETDYAGFGCQYSAFNVHVYLWWPFFGSPIGQNYAIVGIPFLAYPGDFRRNCFGGLRFIPFLSQLSPEA